MKTLKWTCSTFQGRLPRLRFWIYLSSFFFVSYLLDKLDTYLAIKPREPSPIETYIIYIVFSIAAIGIIWFFSSIFTRRLHDFNRPAWIFTIWILIIGFCIYFVVPEIGKSDPEGVQSALFTMVFFVAPFLTIALKSSTPGLNKYGPDPRERAE